MRRLLRVAGSLSSLFPSLLPSLLDALAPPRCPRCGAETWEDPETGSGKPVALCLRCLAELPAPSERCPRCGRESGAFAAVDPCSGCRGEDLGVDGVVAAFPYDGVARDLVLALKFAGRLEAARPLADALVEEVRSRGVPGDLGIPVPLSRARFRRRGYNQAEEIGRRVADAVGLELRSKALVRVRDTPAQTSRSRAGRRRGPLGAFRAARRSVVGRCVVLFDDVLTTGGTLRACSRALRRAGARSVVAAVACRTEGGYAGSDA